jgi:hypothetical protein
MIGWTYNTVSSTFWEDPDVRLWSEEARVLALYLLTCSHRSSEGFYRLSAAVAMDDLRWSREQWEDALAELTKASFCDFDEPGRVMFICKALKYHKIRGPASTQGALNVLGATHGSARLFALFLEAADHYEPEFAAAIRAKYELAEGPYGVPTRG